MKQVRPKRLSKYEKKFTSLNRHQIQRRSILFVSKYVSIRLIWLILSIIPNRVKTHTVLYLHFSVCYIYIFLLMYVKSLLRSFRLLYFCFTIFNNINNLYSKITFINTLYCYYLHPYYFNEITDQDNIIKMETTGIKIILYNNNYHRILHFPVGWWGLRCDQTATVFLSV